MISNVSISANTASTSKEALLLYLTNTYRSSCFLETNLRLRITHETSKIKTLTTLKDQQMK